MRISKSLQDFTGGDVPSQAPAIMGEAVLQLADTSALRVFVGAADGDQTVASATMEAFVYSETLGAWLRAPGLDHAFNVTQPNTSIKGVTFDKEVPAQYAGGWLYYRLTNVGFSGAGTGGTLAQKGYVHVQASSAVVR